MHPLLGEIGEDGAPKLFDEGEPPAPKGRAAVTPDFIEEPAMPAPVKPTEPKKRTVLSELRMARRVILKTLAARLAKEIKKLEGD